MKPYQPILAAGHLAAACFFLHGVSLAATTVVPTESQNVTGDGGTGILGQVLREQDVYASSYFTNGQILITEIRFRPGKSFSQLMDQGCSEERIADSCQ
jgi:hypothetical protein